MTKQGTHHSRLSTTTQRRATFADLVPLQEGPAAKYPKSPADYNKLDGEIALAPALKKASQPSSSEGHLDKHASPPSVEQSIDIQVIESNITGWAESSKVLMSVLDALAAHHPVVGIVVLAFKAVVTLEMKRKNNDKKVIALHLQMQEMMSVLLQLRGIDNPDDQRSDGMLLKHRLEPLMIKITKDITECGNVCDAYSKKNILVKTLKGPIYEQRLAGFLITFSNRQSELQFALILHTSLTTESAASKITSIHDKASSADDKLNLMITLLFRRLDSPHESELMKLIDTKGGAEKCMADDKALMELAAARRRLQGGPLVVNTSPEGGATAALSGATTSGSSATPQYNGSTNAPPNPGSANATQGSTSVHGSAERSYGSVHGSAPYGSTNVLPNSGSANATQGSTSVQGSMHVHGSAYESNPGQSYGSAYGSTPGHLYGSMHGSTPYSYGSAYESVPYSYGSAYGSTPYSYGSAYESVPYSYGSAYGSTPYSYGSVHGSVPYSYGSVYGSTPYSYPAAYGHGATSMPGRRHRRPVVIATSRLDELKSELSEDVDLVLKTNMVIFIRKLDVQKRQLVLELTAVVKTQTDRVITVVDAGPHDRVVDPDFRALWKDMRWRNSVKARTFVFAVHAYFTERYHDTDPLNVFLASSTPKDIQEFRRAQDLAIKKAGEWEAVEYINMVNLRPILESFDDDRSGYITIREVNNFTAAKPEYMSLPEWISYWAVGWHLILSEYKTKICGIISNMHDARKHLLATNRGLVDLYLNSRSMERVDLIMDSLEPFVNVLDTNMRQKSLRYAKEEEKRMDENLKLMAYEIDAPSTLALITGSGRIEKYLFPLLFLLLRHHSRIINVAAREILAREEINTAVDSIRLVLDMVEERAHILRVIFKELYMWGDVSADILSGTAFGMFAKLDETIVYRFAIENLQGSYEDDDEPDELQGQLLKYHVEELDCTVYDLIPIVSPTNLAERPHAVEGTWSGFMESGGDGHGLFQVDFSLNSAHTWTLQGSGLDVNGPFEVLGNVHDDGSFTVTLKREEVSTVSDSVIPLHLSGKLEPSKYSLDVEWGTGPGTTAGKMTLYPGPSELTLFRWNTVQSRTPAQIRWSFACSAILNQVRAKMWSWFFFRDRRDRRSDYTTLYRHQYLLGSLEGEDLSKLVTLERTLSPLDVRFYRSICRSQYSICHHWGSVCHGCIKEITGYQYMCMVCRSYDDVGPIFCSACINLLLGYHEHHDLLRFSRFVQPRERSAFFDAADAVGHRVSGHPAVCSVCHSTEKRIYLCCVICREDLVICEDCDPQRLLNVHAIHDESHPMLRIENEIGNSPHAPSPQESPQEEEKEETEYSRSPSPTSLSPLPSLEWPRKHGFETTGDVQLSDLRPIAPRRPSKISSWRSKVLESRPMNPFEPDSDSESPPPPSGRLKT